MSLEKSKEELLEDGYAELAKSNLNDPEFFGNYRKELKAQKDLYKNLLNLVLSSMNSASNWIACDADPYLALHMLNKTHNEIMEQLPENYDK